MPITKLTPTFNLEQERIEALKQLIPEAVSDGKIDWEVLKEALGEVVEEEGAEHFWLSWAGKREARRLAVTPSQGTLVPVLGEGIDENTTKNLFIEGDNLEVLKLLQKSYAGKVKLIYAEIGKERIRRVIKLTRSSPTFPPKRASTKTYYLKIS
jgi:hypothetical protein